MLSFRTRIFGGMLAVALVVAGIAVFTGRSWFEEGQLEAARQRLLRETTLAAALLAQLGPEPASLPQLARILDMPQERLTLTDATGQVLADTSPGAQPVTRLDNHADRPEIHAALMGEPGFALRPSGTLGTDMAYAAVPAATGRVLRVAVPLDHLRQDIAHQASFFTRLGLTALLLSLVLAGVLSGALRRSLDQMVAVVEAISLGHFQRRLRHIPGREFAPLAEAVNRMAENIEEHIRAAAEQTAQLECVLETMSDGVLVLGPRGRIRRCNRALARCFPQAAAAQGAPVVEVIPSPALQEAVDALMAEPEARSDEAESRARRQRYLHLELSSGEVMSVCLSRPSGQEDAHVPTGVGAVAVFHDITELMRLERVRRDFVANVSHELRTPLTAIQGYAETLMNLDLPPQCRRFGEIILKHGLSLSRMVEDLLSLARLEGKGGSLELSPIDPLEALNQATAQCHESLEARRCTVAVNMPQGCRVMASQPHLTQVFRNLLENAVRFTPEGGTVRVSAQEAENTVTFRVTDDGPGIPKADLERIFERFYQVERHRGQASTGLGLAICKHIIERHGGHIRAESPAPDGSTALVFTLTPVHGAAHS